MKKGFTLIEITITILILAVITLIAVPTINTLLNNSREKAYKIVVDTIEDAGKNYFHIHEKDLQNEIDTKGYVDVTIDQLKEEGFITEDIENPKDHSIMNGNVRIQKVLNKKYEYTYIR